MSNMYCGDCTGHEDSFNQDGAVSYCWRFDRELGCLEVELARNVPKGAYGYCRGFIPIGTDRIKELKF